MKAMSNLIERLKGELPRMASFGAVGIVNALVNYAVFIVLLWYVLEPFEIDGEREWLVFANVVAWSIAVTNSYILNSMTTFAAETGRQLSLHRYLRFAATGLIGMTVETAVLLIAREVIPGDYATEIAKIIAIGFAFVANFAATRILVFPTKQA